MNVDPDASNWSVLENDLSEETKATAKGAKNSEVVNDDH
jgi:hypothetical protein